MLSGRLLDCRFCPRLYKTAAPNAFPLRKCSLDRRTSRLLVPPATVLLQDIEGAGPTAAFPEDGQANRLAEPAIRAIPVVSAPAQHLDPFASATRRNSLVTDYWPRARPFTQAEGTFVTCLQ